MDDDIQVQNSLLDVHFCLGCHGTIFGLDAYVEHRKTQCPAKASPVPSKDASPLLPTASCGNTLNVGKPNGIVLDGFPELSKSPEFQSPLPVPPLMTSPHVPVSERDGNPVSQHAPPPQHTLAIGSGTELSNYHMNLRRKNHALRLHNQSDKEEPEKTDNFFLSLELQSKVGQKSPDAGQAGDVRGTMEKELPISNILSNLEFSSEEEDEESSDDNNDDGGEWVPPHSHTGGKWRPGQRPQRRSSHPHPSHTGGKWRPGETPPGKRKRGRPRKTDKHSFILTDDEIPSLEEEEVENSGFACDECPEVFTTIEAYAQHIAAGHEWSSSLEPDPVLELQEPVINPNESSEKPSVPPAEEKEISKLSSHICSVCDKNFNNKYSMARHILTQFHKRRAENHPDRFKMIQDYLKPLMYLSPFQCMICRFYFNTHEHLSDHMQTGAHKAKVSKLYCPIMCSSCNFHTNDDEEMFFHLSTSEHQDNIKKSDKPCVVKKKLDCQLQCPHCKTNWKSYYMLQRHIEQRHPDGQPATPIFRGRGRTRPKCPFCLTVCHSVAALTIHVRRKHTKQRPFRCANCDVTFCDKHTLLQHFKSARHKRQAVSSAAGGEVTTRRGRGRPPGARGDRSHKCPQCDYVATNYRALRPHYLKAHSRDSVFCASCKKEFVSSKGLEIHQRATGHSNKPIPEGGPSALRCTTCGKTFQDPKWFEFHVVTHSNIFSETDLFEKFKGRDKTSLHYQNYLTEMEDAARTAVLACPEEGCGKKVIKQHMIEHLRIHTGDRVFQCPYCEQGFFSSTVLKKHVHKHLGLTYRKCETCGREFTKVSTYKNHLLSHDKSLQNQHVCSICGMAFTLLECLRVHERRHGEKIHKCLHPGCRQKFVFRSELMEHARIHTGEKPYLCDLCGYKARTKNHMLRHNRTHTGERKYHCDYCTYKAGNKTHLRRHMRIHIGSKPYKCPYCSYCCNTHENIRKHIMKTKKHEGLKIYPCKYCSYGTNVAKEYRHHLEDYHQQHLKIENVDVLSVVAGIYDKEGDVSQPAEGNLILPVKERKHRQTLRRPKDGPLLVKMFPRRYKDQDDSAEHERTSLAEASVIQYSGSEDRWFNQTSGVYVSPEIKDQPSSPTNYSDPRSHDSLYEPPHTTTVSPTSIPSFRDFSTHHSVVYNHPSPFYCSGVYKYSTPHHSAFVPSTSEGYTTPNSDAIFPPGTDIIYHGDRHSPYASHSRIDDIQNMNRISEGQNSEQSAPPGIPLVANSVDIY